MEFSKVSEKGTTTIPKKIREQLGIETNDTLCYLIGGNGQVNFRKVNERLLNYYANKDYQTDKTENEEKKKMEISEGGEERTQTQGGIENESLDKSGRSPEETQSDTIRIPDKQNQPQATTTTGTPDQQRETQKERMKNIGGEER